MGIWNDVADVAGVVLAPETGGASLALLPAANAAINSAEGSGGSSSSSSDGTAGEAASDPSNYDTAGNYIGPGAYDDSGNWVDLLGVGWQGDTAQGVPNTQPVGPVQGGTTGPVSGGPAGSSGFTPNASTIATIAKALGGAGAAISGAETAAAKSALNQETLGLQAASQNTTGQSAYQNELMANEALMGKQQNTALTDVALASKVSNPSVSPYDVAPPTYSPAFTAATTALEQQGLNRLQNPANSAVAPVAPPTPYTPISPSGVQAATGTTPSTLQTVGQWLAPALGIASAVAPVL